MGRKNADQEIRECLQADDSDQGLPPFGMAGICPLAFRCPQALASSTDRISTYCDHANFRGAADFQRLRMAGVCPEWRFETVATVFGRAAAALLKQGEPRPVVDLLIAATAKRHGLIVATLNARHFTGIPGVQVEDWSEKR